MVKSTRNVLHIVFILITTMLMGCSGNSGIFKNLSSLNPNPIGESTTPKTEPETSQCAKSKSQQFDENKAFQTTRIVHHASVTDTQLQASSVNDVNISTSDQFVGLKKTNCAMSATWYKHVIITNEPKFHSSMKRHAFSFRVKEKISLSQLEKFARSEKCLLSVSPINDEDDAPLAASDWTNNDPHFSQQKWMTDIKLPESLDDFFHKDYGIKQDVVVADIDTGVYFFHEDLGEEVLWKQSSGLIGYNVLDPSVDALDDLGVSGGTAAHGSKIAGIIGAVSGNNKGIIGMFPKNIKVMAVKYIDNTGSGKAPARLNGLQYAIDNGADAINLSIGTGNNETTFRQMIESFTNKGGFVAAAAGNESLALTANSSRYPAVWGHTIDGLMTVGGSQSGSKNIWSGSNYSPKVVEIIAPGGSIFTTIPWNNNIKKWGNYYGSTSGTSFSTPMVAAAGGLAIGMLKSNGISFTAKDIEDLIVTGSQKITGLNSYAVGGQYLDMKGLVDAIHTKYPQIKSGIGNDSPPEEEQEEESAPPEVICP